MTLRFYEDTHSYISDDNTSWTSVTSLVHKYQQPFNAEEMAPKSSRNSRSKWYKVPVPEILAAWDTERERSTTLGTWYHNKREQGLLSQGNVIAPIIEQGIKIAPSQKLVEGIYPEHMVYLQSAGVCGQSDYVQVIGNKVIIRDYKTCKEIKTKGFSNWEGKVSKMLAPVQHMDECDLSHYSLQLSIYMYIILRHNPHLQSGDMYIEHVLFEEGSRDKWDYPIYKQDSNGEYIVKEIIEIPIPYMKKEVELILNHHIRKNR